MSPRVKRALLVVAPDRFRDEELFDTMAVLEASGVEVSIASSASGTVKGILGGNAIPNVRLAAAHAADYDAVVFIGGPGAAAYFDDKVALNLARDAYDFRKIVGAICIAPSILANAGMLHGVNATSYPSQQQNLRAKGAIFSNRDVISDGRIVTANGPQAAKEFGRKLAEMLRE